MGFILCLSNCSRDKHNGDNFGNHRWLYGVAKIYRKDFRPLEEGNETLYLLIDP